MLQDAKIYLIFEYLTMDLKKYMDTGVPKDGQMDPKLTKSYLYQVLFHQLCLEPKFLQLYSFSCCKASCSVTRGEFSTET